MAETKNTAISAETLDNEKVFFRITHLTPPA